MSRFLNTGLRFLGQPQFLGRGRPVQSPVEESLDATLYEGAAIYGSDGQFYYSDGVQWRIPTGVVDIGRPSALPPTNSEEAKKLRLTQFFSPRGLTQTGVYFEVAASQDGFDNPILTRDITSTTASEYETIYPGDGLTPGQEFWWRGLYTGTEGGQSEFSLPFRQVYPDLIDDPSAVTAEGATSGAVELTAFNSAFGLSYVETQIELWDEGSDPEVDPPLETVTSVVGASVFLPDTLVDGNAYLWRGRYGGRVGGAGAITYTDWSSVRTILNGAASMIMVYDPVKAQNRTITLPLGIYGGIVDVLIAWGDGSTQTVQSSGNVSHTYAEGDDSLRVVTISGQLEQYGGNANLQGLVRVDNIGFKLGLTSLREMFRNCTSNTTYVNPALPPQVTDCTGMFWEANPGFNVSALDMSNVQTFERMFFYSDYNGPLEWNTGSATNMREMFYGYVDRTKFNHPSIGVWDVSNVTTFSGMFIRNPVFNQDLSAWDTSSATTMSHMFGTNSDSAAIDGDTYNGGGLFQYGVTGWNVSKVTDFSYMFGDSDSNRGRYWNEDISGWDVSSAVTMEGMFKAANEFNQPIAGWDVSNVTSFDWMFANTSFNQPLTDWNLSSATNVDRMFSVSQFNNDVSGWVLPANISGMFKYAFAFNHPSITTWDTSGVTNMADLFLGANVFNQPIGNWNTSNVTNMSYMFQGTNIAYAFNQPIESWDVSSVVTMKGMFSKTKASASERKSSFNQPLAGWDVSNVVDMSYMFGCIDGTNRPNVIPFNQDISSWQLNPAGVNLEGFMGGGSETTHGFSTENYSKLLAGWANNITLNSGPFGLSADFSFRTYDATDYFVGETYEDAVEGRTYLTGSTPGGAGWTISDGGLV